MKFLPKTLSNKNTKSNFLANLPNFSNIATFTSAGNSQIWTVPSGVNIIWVKMWGAGGAGYVATGGGGGFVSGYIKTKPGQRFEIYVGYPGENATTEENCLDEPYYGSDSTAKGGEGCAIKGYSDVTHYVTPLSVVGQYTFNTYAIVGGGGGGKYTNGGAGGGVTGSSGVGQYGGPGATGSLGGYYPYVGGNSGTNAYTGSNNSQVGSLAQGGDGIVVGEPCLNAFNTDGASGGSGYAGGAGTSDAGGGGSSFFAKDWGLLNMSGSASVVANNSDPDYSAGKGTGGSFGSGGDGYVIIRY